MTDQNLESTAAREDSAPHPDHDSKPDSPGKLKGQSWGLSLIHI